MWWRRWCRCGELCVGKCGGGHNFRAAMRDPPLSYLLRPPPPPSSCPLCSTVLLCPVFQVCPPPLFEELFTRFLSGQLHELCLHPNANFVVQAAIAATTTPSVVRGSRSGRGGYVCGLSSGWSSRLSHLQFIIMFSFPPTHTCVNQIKAMFDELAVGSTGGGGLGELLRRHRGGVVAALVSACGRIGACQKEACALLEKALMGISAGVSGGVVGVGLMGRWGGLRAIRD